jgi:hypothetical protein
MKPESPRLEDAYTGRQGNESREEPPRFRQRAFPGAVLHRSGCPLKDMRGSLAYVGWFGFVCIGPIPDQLAVFLEQALRSIHFGAAMQQCCRPIGAYF